MANDDRPHGFLSVASMVGRPGYFRNYTKAAGYATAVGFNDLVVNVAAGIDIEQAAAGGAFLGISYANSAASTAATHPVELLGRDNVCEGQEDSDTSDLVAASTGLKADIIVAARNATTGLSQMEIDSSSAATTATLDAFLLRLAPYVDNETGNFSRWFVNFHDLAIAEAQAGI